MESLYLKWIDYDYGNKYNIGALIKDAEKKMYYFKIDNNALNRAKKIGFNVASLPFMPDKIYKSTQLFSFFKMRIPKIEQYNSKELDSLLKRIHMTEFDEFEYLRKTKGKIATDNFILEETK